MNALRYILVVCLLFGMGSALWADVGEPVMDEFGNIIDARSVIKTPPLRTSDTFFVPLELHNSFPISNWAGFRVKFHILDSKEISLTPLSTITVINATGLGSGPLVSPNFPQSTPSVQSVPFYRTVWDPFAQQSGRHLPASAWFPLLDLKLHAKSTDNGQNSDVDMTVMAWNIRHLRPHITPNQGSTQFRSSAYVWARSDYVPHPPQPGFEFQLPDPIPTDYPNAHWVHIPFPWHLQSGIGSHFIATLAGTAFIGIEHVPEPVTAVLAGGGVLLLVCSWGLRRRRMAA